MVEAIKTSDPGEGKGHLRDERNVLRALKTRTRSLLSGKKKGVCG